MASIFLAYDSRDRDLARYLEDGLGKKDHICVWGVDELIAGRGWGELMPRRIAEADAVIALLTENSERSRSVWSEIGAARALANSERSTALLPVVVGLEKAPGYVDDILKLWCSSSSEENLDKLIAEVDTAIKAHLAAVEAEASRDFSPKIFISHRHKDQKIAEALTRSIRAAFELEAKEIRCTSVQPYRLPFGKNTSERLRDEIGKASGACGKFDNTLSS